MKVIYDDDTGSILCITPQIDEVDKDKNYITVSIDEVKDILEGKESIYSYHVFYNLLTKEREFGPIDSYDEHELDINEILYEISNATQDADLVIKQDLVNTCWKFFPNKELSNKLAIENISVRGNLYFSVTEKGNPNILYRQLVVDFRKLLEDHYFIVPFKQKFEFIGKSVSIFTNKRFSSYQYKVIPNE